MLAVDRFGTEIVVRDGRPPFRVYEKRPRHVMELLDVAELWGERTHLVQGERRISFRQLVDSVEQGSQRLRDLGLRRGGLCLLLADNSIDWVIAFWSVLGADGVVVLGNMWWSDEELRQTLRDCRPDVIVVDGRDLRAFELDVPCVPATSLSAPSAGSSPAPSVGNEGAAGLDLTAHDEDQPAVVLFTAGSTGPPKGVILSHRSVIALQQCILHVTRRLPLTNGSDRPPEVVLATGPLFHIGGIQNLVRSALTGGTLVFHRGRFDARELLDLIEREGVTRWGGVPTMLSRLVAEASTAGRVLGTVTSLTVGGAPVAPALLEQAKGVFPNASTGMSQIYGLSEAGGTLTSASGRDANAHPGTAGRPLPIVELRIDRPDAAGEGEILARSPTQMNGYWGSSDTEELTPDGWLCTGDLGRIDESGYLYVTGRAKDVIIRGGENVAGAHVENALLAHTDVVDAAVVGVPDADLGELVVAVVRVRDANGVDSGEIRTFLAGRLAYFEVPSRIVLTEDPLPTTGAGKVDKAEIRRQFFGSN